MDENKINPELGNSEESNEQEVNTAENASEEVASSENVSEGNPEVKTFSELVAESANEGEPAEVPEAETSEAEVSEAPSTPEKPKKKKGKIAALVALIVVLVGATVAMVFFMLNATPKVDVEKTVLTVGDVDSNAGEFINYYNMYSYYATYYGFTSEQIKEYAIEDLKSIDIYYAKAVAEGYTLSEEEIAQVDANIASVEQGAETYSMTSEEYLATYICEDYSIEMYRTFLEKQMLAQKYYNEKLNEINTKYEGDDAAVQAKYDADRTAYDLTDVSYWYFDSTVEDAQTQADAIVSKVNGGMSFTDAIKAVTEDSEAVPNDLKDYTKSVISSNFSVDAAEWIYSFEDGAYVNGAGAVTTIETNGVIYVLYVNAEPSKNEAVPVTIDYICVDVSTDTSVKTEAELKVAAKATATSILKELESGTVDADAFAALRDSYDSGDNELVSGDVYEEMTADGSHDEAVEAWAFDSSRKVGDYALVEGDGCYYILYYTAVNEHSVWYQTAFEALVDDAYNEWSSEVTAEFEDKIVIYEDVIEEIVAYLTSESSY